MNKYLLPIIAAGAIASVSYAGLVPLELWDFEDAAGLSLKTAPSEENQTPSGVANSGSNGWCPSYEHTRGLMWMKSNGNTILPDFITGVNETGFNTFIMPLIACFIITGLWVFVLTRGEKLQLIIKRTFFISFICLNIVPYL